MALSRKETVFILRKAFVFRDDTGLLKSSCPSSSALSDYLRDMASEEEAFLIRVHLFYCDECFGLLMKLEPIVAEEGCEGQT